MGLQDDLRMQWRTGGMVVRLILINVAVFIGLLLIYLILLPIGGSGNGATILRDTYVVQWLRSTADLGTLITRPWTVFTYMFVHTGLGHLFWNMILLWFGGRLFQDLLGGKRLLGHYLLGGLSGFALFALAHNLLPGLHGGTSAPGILGASAGVLSVFIGIAAYRPDMIVNLILIGPVKLMYVAAVFLLLDLVGIGSGDGVAHEAHIGGALYGFIAARQLSQGRDWSLSFVQFLERLLAPFTRKRGPRMRVEKKFTRSAVSNDERYNANKRDEQARVDHILDKISRSGYDSLSKEEKDFLFKSSDGKG
ncbi:MAG: rhomboid family intramembrane serine protease [Flavobacteriales bacterium]|jgi:membrane associated rhomboid family serine protease|nr:rhomboid family intramembrane serine protease [Flavobacteriales bacterium]